MKKILSAVLALCMIFGCMTAGFTAQAASTQADLQNGINQAIANGDAVYTWNGGNLTLTKTLTINGNIKVDFNGATIKGAPHFSTVYIGSGNVELYNVTLEGRGAKYYEIPSFISEIADARTTLLIGNANVTLDSVVVLGAMVRVVGTQETLPMSDAIGIGAANAVVNLKNVRAFGNIGVENLNGSTVNVEECIIGGYQADFYNDAKVNFAAGTTQYRSMDLIKEALADCVTLTANEEKYMNALFDEYFEITASVKDLNYVAPTYDYDADTDTLTVTATADKPVAKVQNAFEYSYVPKTATILSTTEDFVLSNDGTYVATFANIPADTQCDTDLDYALSLDLGEDADAYIHQFLNNITNFVADFPAFMGKAFEELDVAVDKYINGEQGYATILWNFYNDKDVGAKTLINAIEDPTEKAKANADVKKLLGPLFDLCGASLMGNDRLNTALAAKVAGTSTKRQDTEIESQMNIINNTYGSTITAENGGIGLLDTFLAYAGDIEALLLKTEGGKYVINDVEGLGEYIGANYLEMYDYLKDVGDFVRNVVALINDSDNYVMKLLEENNFTIDGKKLSDFASDLNGYVATMDDLFAAADKFFATNPSYTAIVKEYGAAGITDTCGRYLEKAYNAALNPDAYLGLNTNGNFVEGFSFAKDATYTTPADPIVGPTVTVNVVGYGKYAVEGTTYTTTQTFNVEEGADFTVAPVEFDDEDPLFAYIAIGDSNGNERLSPKGGNLKVYSDTIITVYFNASVDPEEPYYNFVFMTNYELSTAFLGSLNQEDLFNDDDYPPEAPLYEGAEFIGWSTENISGDAAKQAGNCMDDSELYNYCFSADANATLYAIFSLPQKAIAEEELLEVMTMKETFVDNANSHKAYFTVLFSEGGLDAGDKIVEAGVLASSNYDRTENATPNGGAGIIKGVVTGDSYPILYTYAVYSNSHSNLTVYAKGFVTVQHFDGTLETTYTGVYTQALTAY